MYAMFELMKFDVSNVYVSFSLYILIYTPHYAVSASHYG